jgi:hypothetical protein
VTRGTSIEKFLNNVAPGAAIVVDYSLDSLASALNLPAEAWMNAGRHAKKGGWHRCRTQIWTKIFGDSLWVFSR